MSNNADDAWKQLDDLLRTFTKTWEVRRDIEVVAHATDRCVSMNLSKDTGEPHPAMPGLTLVNEMSTGKRNVGTMRELAQVINMACDFIEESNPEWAGRRDLIENSKET